MESADLCELVGQPLYGSSALEKLVADLSGGVLEASIDEGVKDAEISLSGGATKIGLAKLRDSKTSIDVSGDMAEAKLIEAVLKMDCEGYEYDIILNNYEHVKIFDEVYFEYHAYTTKISVDVLLKKLSKDYKYGIVSDEEFYKRHGYSKKLLDLVKLDMLRCERLSCVAVFCSQEVCWMWKGLERTRDI